MICPKHPRLYAGALMIIMVSSSAVAGPPQRLDINGAEIGMTPSQVSAILRTGLQRTTSASSDEEWYVAKSGNTGYLLEFTPRHHLYDIDMSQSVGSGLNDNVTRGQILQRLASKYGPPDDIKGGRDNLGADWHQDYHTGNADPSVEASMSPNTGKLELSIENRPLLTRDSLSTPDQRSSALDSTKF